jgi:hypothetical protein
LGRSVLIVELDHPAGIVGNGLQFAPIADNSIVICQRVVCRLVHRNNSANLKVVKRLTDSWPFRLSNLSQHSALEHRFDLGLQIVAKVLRLYLSWSFS